jgi:type I restriction enzyme S subunit
MNRKWIDDLPNGWDFKQLRFIFRIHSGATPKSGELDYWDGDINWITPEDLGNNVGKDIADSRRKISKAGFESCALSIAPAGSIALSTRAPIGHLAKTTLPSCVNQGCRILEPKEGKSDYWYYACLAAKPVLVSLGQGSTFMELPRQSLASVKLPVPPIKIQQSIAWFLDFKTEQIDELISKKRALLAKLAEKRMAVIAHASTKGLNPSAPTKDSGVSWLGRIPKHWETKRLRFLTTMSGGMTPSTANPDFWGGDIPWITPKDMKNEVLSSSADTLTEEALKETGISLYDPGKVLIVVRGMILAHTFPVAINAVRTTVNQDMKVISTVLNREYLALLLRGVQPLVLSIVEEAAHGTKILRTDVFKNLRLPVPPREEQGEIVSRVYEWTNTLDTQQQHIQTMIDRLLEYRSALITNAVTGKIDVRNVTSPLNEDLTAVPLEA